MDATNKKKRKIRIGLTHCSRTLIQHWQFIELHGCQRDQDYRFQIGGKAQALKP
jgi:hypothetical protein